jgi:hypothetical protein
MSHQGNVLHPYGWGCQAVDGSRKTINMMQICQWLNGFDPLVVDRLVKWRLPKDAPTGWETNLALRQDGQRRTFRHAERCQVLPRP